MRKMKMKFQKLLGIVCLRFEDLVNLSGVSYVLG